MFNITKLPNYAFFGAWVILTSLCFANFNMPFIWISYVPLIIVLHRLPITKIAKYGFLFSYLYYFLTLYWLIAFHEASAFFAFPIYALYLMTAMIFIRYIGAKFPQFRALSFPLIWLAFEVIRSLGFFGFRWNTPADALWKQLIFFQSADLVGSWGVSFLILLVNSTIAEFVLSYLDTNDVQLSFLKNRILIFATSFFFLCNLAYGVSSYKLWANLVDNKLPNDTVVLLQPNRQNHSSWRMNGLQLSQKYLDMMRSVSNQNVDLIVQTEVMISDYLWERVKNPQFLSNTHNALLPEFINISRELGVPVVLTHFAIGQNNKHYNAATLVRYTNNQYTTNQYNKIHIVPFGEWVPGSEKWPWLRNFLDDLGAAWASAGTQLTIMMSKSGALFAIMICFDDVYPMLGRLFVEKGAQYFANATNDGWAYRWKLGASAPLWQHLANTIHTSISLRRSIARSVNTGITGVVDPLGRVDVSPIPTYADGVYTTKVTIMPKNHRSVYVLGGWIVEYLIFFIAMILLFTTILSDKKAQILKEIL